MIVADATPLIHLARAGHADLLPRLYERVVVPHSVREELTAGVGRPESHALEEAFGSWLGSRKLSAPARRVAASLREGAPIAQGESEAIALAESLRAPLLMDDRVAANLARLRGLEVRWTTSVVLEAHALGILARGDARQAIEDLVSSGLWVRQDVLLRILAALERGTG